MTVTSELINVYAETQAKMKTEFAKYMKDGLMPRITTHVWGENGNYPLLIVVPHCVVLAFIAATDVKPPYVPDNIDYYCTNSMKQSLLSCCILSMATLIYGRYS